MELITAVIIGCAVGITFLVMFWRSDYRFKQQYKPKWFQFGSDDAKRGERRMRLTASWLQKFYDEGYDAVIKEKEAAHV